MPTFKFKSSFANISVKPLVSEEKDKFLAIASLQEVGKFIPNLDPKNIDLLPVAFNACVVNRGNKNKDIVDTDTALAFYKQFIYKPINLEHDRKKVIGMITTASFSEFKTDKPLTEEQVKGKTEPFNITLGGLVWRIVSPDTTDLIEESNDPTSDKYEAISASWELGFTEYNVALFTGGKKNIADASKIITDQEEIKQMQDCLTALGGDGKYNDYFAYRMPTNDVLPLGIGFTEKPAAEVKGIATKTPTTNDTKEQLGMPQKESFDNKNTNPPKETPYKEPTQEIKNEVGIVQKPAFSTISDANASKSENNISQSQNPNVNTERHIYMKLTSIKDVTDENLKQSNAADISNLIADEIRKGNDTWLADKNRLNTELAAANEKATKASENADKLDKELKELKATVTTLQNEKTEREKVEKFNVRMASITEAFELDDEARAAVVEDVKAIASDEDFAKYQKKANVLLKGFAKKADKNAEKDFKKKDKDNEKGPEKAKADDDGGDMSEAKKNAKASEATAAAVDQAVDNANKEKGGLPNAGAEQVSLKEKYKNAFAKENFIIK